VIYLSRSEIFAGKTDYQKPFLPIEADNSLKDDAHEAIAFFHELRIASFENNINAYLGSHSALKLRAVFEQHCGRFRPAAPKYAETVEKTAKAFLEKTKCNETKAAIFAMAKAMITEGDILKGESIPDAGNGDDDQDRAIAQMRVIVELLDAVRTDAECPNQGRLGMKEMTELQRRELVENALEHHVWTERMFVSRISKVPGVTELTSTPFLVKIVADIMYILHSMSASPADVKQQMLLLLGDKDEMAEKAWALLRKKRHASDAADGHHHEMPICSTICSSVEHLAKTQAILKLQKEKTQRKLWEQEDHDLAWLLKLLDTISTETQLKMRTRGQQHWKTVRESVVGENGVSTVREIADGAQHMHDEQQVHDKVRPMLTDGEAEEKENLCKVLMRVLKQKQTRRYSIYSGMPSCLPLPPSLPPSLPPFLPPSLSLAASRSRPRSLSLSLSLALARALSRSRSLSRSRTRSRPLSHSPSASLSLWERAHLPVKDVRATRH